MPTANDGQAEEGAAGRPEGGVGSLLLISLRLLLSLDVSIHSMKGSDGNPCLAVPTRLVHEHPVDADKLLRAEKSVLAVGAVERVNESMTQQDVRERAFTSSIEKGDI